MNAITANYYLKCHSIFGKLTAHDLDELKDHVQFHRYRKGEIIDFISRSGNDLFYIISGKAKLIEVEDEGSTMLKILLHEGDIFGELVASTSRYREYAEILTEYALVGAVPISAIRYFMARNPSFSLAFTHYAWERYRKIEKRIFQCTAVRDTRTRLISFIEDLAKDEGTRIGGLVRLKNYLTHQELASIIGSTRVTVTSILNSMKNGGTVRYCKDYFELTDSSALAASA